MNQRFESDNFTPKHTADKLERFEVERKRKEKLQFVADKFRKLDESIAVPPLVVVPSENFEQP